MPATARIRLFLGVSGFSAAIYALTWLRELRLVFGETLPAYGAVLSVLFVGLAVGHRLGAKRARRADNPLELFAFAQGAAALWAALTPILLVVASAMYGALGGAGALGLGGATIVRVVSSAVLVIPTALALGASIPLAGRSQPGVLVIGAAVGMFVVPFALLALFGTQLTLWLGCTIHLLSAVLARTAARARSTAESGIGRRPSRGVTADEWVHVVAAFAAGFTLLLSQLAWSRVLLPLFGGSLFATATLVTVTTLAVGCGMLAGARWLASGTLARLGALFAFGAVAVVLPFVLGDRIAFGAQMVRSFAVGGVLGQALGWGIVAALVAAPAAFAGGCQLAVVADVARGRALPAFWGGAALACLAGTVLIVALFASTCWQISAWINALGAMALFVVHAMRRRDERATVGGGGALALLAALMLVLSAGPTRVLRHAPIGSGGAENVLTHATMNDVERWLRFTRRALVWDAEGLGSRLAIRAPREVDFTLDGRVGGGAISGAGVQLASGIVAALRHPAPKRVLVLGLGNGAMAGWLAELDGVVAVDVIEPEPAMRRVAEACAAVNHDVLTDQRTTLRIADPREALGAMTDTYDLVVIGATLSHRPTMLTSELYAAVKARLNEGGLLAQVVRTRDFDLDDAGIVYATMTGVFGAVETWHAQRGHLVLLGGGLEPIDAAAMRSRLTQPAAAAALYAGWHVRSLEGVLAHFVAGPGLAEELAALVEGRVNTDDDNAMELNLARKLGRGGDVEVAALRELASRMKAGRPPVRGEVSWANVADAAMSVEVLASGASPEPSLVVDAAQGHRFAAIRAWSSGDMETAARAWGAQKRAATLPVEIIVLSESYASLGDARALPLIDRLATFDPVTARVIKARFHLAEENVAASVRELDAAFAAHRENPWVVPAVMRRALSMAADIARLDRAQAVTIANALVVPFAVRSLDFMRTRVLLDVATLAGSDACMAAVEEAGQHFPWERKQLVGRVRCIEVARRGNLTLARRELERYVDNEGIAVDVAFLPSN